MKKHELSLAEKVRVYSRKKIPFVYGGNKLRAAHSFRKKELFVDCFNFEMMGLVCLKNGIIFTAFFPSQAKERIVATREQK